MVIRSARPEDFEAIAEVVNDWWGRAVAGSLPRLFLDHFYGTSSVADDASGLAGFLIGFHSPSLQAVSYVHFVGVRPNRRGSGLAAELYSRFADSARAVGSAELRAITGPSNSGSVRFHERLGFTVTGPVADYNGPGKPMITFTKSLR